MSAPVHYRPHGRVPVCGAYRGLPSDGMVSLKKSTDIRRVTCPECWRWIRSVMPVEAMEEE